MRSIERWHFQWPWRTPNPVFQGQGIFEVEYLKYHAFYGQCFYRTLIGNDTQSIEWCHLEWPLTRISRSRHFISRISENGAFYRQSYYCTRRKVPNIWNDTMFGDLDWPLNASRGFVSISWVSCMYILLSYAKYSLTHSLTYLLTYLLSCRSGWWSCSCKCIMQS